MQPTPDHAHSRFRDHPLRRLYAELYCLALTFIFHQGNNHGRKLATLVVVGVWASLEVGAAYGAAELPNQFTYIRLFVGILIGRMWGIEFNNIAGLELNYGGENDGD